jgi:hypothetical protein
VIPREPVRTLLNEAFICVAIDCDRMEPDLRALALAHMAPLRVLPFILVLDPEGAWLGGRTGSTSLEALSELLETARRSRA